MIGLYATSMLDTDRRECVSVSQSYVKSQKCDLHLAAAIRRPLRDLTPPPFTVMGVLSTRNLYRAPGGSR